MGRVSACAVVAVFATWFGACKDTGTVQVHSLTFKGAQKVRESALKTVVTTRVNSRLPWGARAYFERARFDEDLKRIQAYYLDRGYPDARVTGFDVKLNNREDAVDITVNVREGEPILVAAVNFVGFEVLPDSTLDDLKKQIPLKAGQPRDRQLAVSAHELSVNALRDRGYPYSVVSVEEDDGPTGKTAALTLRAQPGQLAHFGPAEIAGNQHVSSRVVRRSIAYKEGDLYRLSRVQDTQRRLYATQLFQFVTVEPTPPGTRSTDVGTSAERVTDGQPPVASAASPDDQPAAVPTRITLVESKPERTKFGVGYGTEEKARADVQYRRFNFLGGGRTAEAHVRWSSLDRGVRLSLNQPELLAGLSLGAIGQQWYTYTPAYRSVVGGGKAVFTRRLGPRTYWSVSVIGERHESSIESDAFNNAKLRNGLIALGLNPVTGQQSGTLGAVGADLQWTTSNNVLNATRGFQVTLHAEQAGRILPGSFKYWSASLDARHYLPLPNRIIWANRLQLGNISPRDGDNNVPFGKRFFLGGSTSIRGWGIYEVGPLAGGLPIGGDSMVAFTSEVRAPVQGKLGAVVFLDGGNVWAESFGMNTDLRYAVGSGIRYETPIGPLRFDAGYQLNPESDLLVNGSPQPRRWRVHFSVGQAF
jgi:outer membrane protein assembly factor BamA